MLLPSKYVRYVFFYLAIVNSLGVGAQNTANPSTYALLWEISGRDLSQPSFLFGSMHVRESAAFNFPDSLGGYLRSCTAFANEVHLDSAMIRMLEVYLGKEEPQIDEDYLRALSTIKVGEDFMPPRTGATKTPSLWSSLTRQLGHKRDTIHYPTFLDAYLMEYARCQGLRLYGLEEIDEHLYEPGDESGKGFSIFERALFQLQDYYYAGDITEIGYLVAEQGPHFDQMALVPRNYVMCRRIKEILRTEKALFAVVGAAHLPGKTGLVQLLREEGYQLRPIPADRDSRSPADSLLGKILCQREWPKQVGGRGGYHFTFPFAQCFERSAGASSQYLGYDIGQGLSYLLLTDRFLPYQFEDFETRFFTDDGYQIEANEPITVAGLEGRRYELFRPDEDIEHYIGYVFFQNQQLFYLQVGAYEKSVLARPQLYQSFVEGLLLKPASYDKWITVVDSTAGFAARLPAHYELTYTPEINQYEGPFGQVGGIYHAGFDLNTAKDAGATTWILYGDLTSDPLEPETDSDQQARAKEWLEEFFGASFSYEGAPARFSDSQTLSGEFYKKYPVKLQGKLIQRGNRFYALVAIDRERNILTKKLLPGFRTLPVFPTQTAQLVEIDSLLQVYLPAPPQRKGLSAEIHDDLLSEFIDRNAPPDEVTTATDPLTGNHHWLRIHRLPQFFGTTDTLGFLRSYLDSLSSAYDSTELLGVTTVQGFPGLLARMSLHQSKLLTQVQIYTAGNRVIEKLVQGSAEASRHPNVIAFFDEDQWDRSKLGPTVLTTRANELLQALASENTAEVEAALAVVSVSGGLQAEHAPALRQVILRPSWPGDLNPTTAQRQLLAYYHSLSNQQLHQLEQLYRAAANTPHLRRTILNWLGDQGQEVYWSLYFRVLFQHTSAADDIGRYIHPSLSEQPQLIRARWPALLTALAQAEAHPLLWQLVAAGYHQDLDLAPLQLLAQNHLEDWLGGQASPSETELEALLHCLQQVPASPAILPLLKTLMNSDASVVIRASALGARLRAGDKIKRAALRPLLNHNKLRYPCLRVLNSFPSANLLPKNFEGAAMAQYLLDQHWQAADKALVSEVRLSKKIAYRYQNQTYHAYVFTFTYDDDFNRLAVVGLFQQDGPYFRDEGWINTTDYTVSRRRQDEKAIDLLDELRRRRE